MSLLSRMRVDLALGIVTVGALLYLYRRDIGAIVGSSGQRKRKRENPEEEVMPAPALAPLFNDLSHVDITERILQHCDAQTVMRLASTSKHLNELVTSSLDVQLSLRQYHHKIPPLLRPSAEQRRQLASLSKREQLDELVDREERLSRFRHTDLQRCEMPYIDVLCSGDYMLVTRSLHGKFRTPDNPDSGPIEDGFTVMFPEEGRTLEEGQLGLDGYRDWTYDVGQEIADIGARSDDNLIAIATWPYEWDQRPAHLTDGPRPKMRTLRIAFYHLDEYEAHPIDEDRSLIIPHAEAKHKVVHFEIDAQESRAIRLRLGPNGRLAIWAKHREGCRHARAFVYDWKNGLGIGSPWVNDQTQYGIAQDFTFCNPDIMLIAVLTTTNQCKAEMTPNNNEPNQETRLEIRIVRLPPVSAAVQLSPKSTESTIDDPIIIRPDTFPRCTHVASFRFPSFTHKWVNPGPSPDEILPVEGGQSFRLAHCSIAAKPSPGTNPSGDDQGLLCITIEGDFGPVTHPEPGGIPHDHGVIAFCTIAGSVFSRHYYDDGKRFGAPKVYIYDDWHQGHVSWDFGPASTWVTGYGTRTSSVSRFVGLSAEAEDGAEMPDPDTARRSTIVNVRMRNYDPVAVQRSGRISRHPLGRPANKLTEKESEDTGLLTPAERRALPPIPDDFMRLVDMTRAQLQQAQIQVQPQPQGQGQAPFPPIQIPPPPANLADLVVDDLFAGMAGPAPGDTFRVVTKASNALPEMFGDYPLESSLPFYEANVSIPLDDEDEPRNDAASEHPFKTILARDKLIVCDDAGFDLLYF